MKKIYLVDCDCDNFLGQSLVNPITDKVYGVFYTRKSAIEHLVNSFHKMKTKYADKIADLKRYCKKHNQYEVITIDCWVAKVEDDFDINTDCFWEQNYSLLACRYLCGRY